MQEEEKRKRLLSFLDEKAFNPIIRKSADQYSGDSRKKFEDIKRSTENERRRFHDEYRTAEEVKNKYLSDLHSQTAGKKNKELEQLGLPRMPQFEKDFLDLCKKIGV